MFNSSQIYHFKSNKCAITDDNNQLKDLNYNESWLYSLEIIGTNKYIPCIAGCKLNIASLRSLLEDVNSNHNFKYLLTSRLNQDSLENVFSIIRNAGGHKDSPTAQNLIKIISGMMTNNIMQNSVRGNCIDDATSILELMKTGDIEIFEVSKPKKNYTTLWKRNWPKNL